MRQRPWDRSSTRLAPELRHVALDLLFGHPADQYRRLPAAYNALTSEQVRAAAARIFSVTPTLVTVLPE